MWKTYLDGVDAGAIRNSRKRRWSFQLLKLVNCSRSAQRKAAHCAQHRSCASKQELTEALADLALLDGPLEEYIYFLHRKQQLYKPVTSERLP